MGVYIRTDQSYSPTADTIGYYTFDDQNASQITDFSGKGNNLTGKTIPRYVLVSGTNYAGDFTNESSSSSRGGGPYKNFNTTYSSYTILCWVKFAGSTSSFSVFCDISQGALLCYGNYTGEIGIVSADFSGYSTLKSSAALNTWYMVAITYTGGTYKKYFNGQSVGTWSKSANLSKIALGGTVMNYRFIGQIGEALVESKVWSDTEISNYYNLTKGEYGL